jgi:predicted GNAT superfamily acetyltransferase
LTTIAQLLYTIVSRDAGFVRRLRPREISSAMNASATQPRLSIRDLTTYDDLCQLQAVEKEVWGLADADVLPLTIAIALQAAGSIFVGAFDRQKLVGFAFGFLGREGGRLAVHSHMLAVLDPYRHLDLGYKLKLAQRERALAMGVPEMTWTFDPLQSRNAHFNFTKLGVMAETYKIDFYGPETSSVLHQNGTDRLWVRWLLDSQRVRERCGMNGAGRANGGVTKDPRAEMLDALRLLAPLVRFNGAGHPARADLAGSLARQRVSIEIPGDILEVERADMALAREWREATRWALWESLKAGFRVTEFCRSIRGQQGPGAYLLQRPDAA